MAYSRFYLPPPLAQSYQKQPVTLDSHTSHYMQRVLRLRLGDAITVFDGLGGEYTAVLSHLHKKNCQIELQQHHPIERESSLKTTLIQAISRPEHMDYSIQKAVELGVTEIVPLITTRSPPLKKQVLLKRQQHWQKIIHNACEQCGRNRLPLLHPALDIPSWLQQTDDSTKWLLDVDATETLADYKKQPLTAISIVIGAEGGLTTTEKQQFQQADYQAILFGQRVLRTETASTALLAVCLALWG